MRNQYQISQQGPYYNSIHSDKVHILLSHLVSQTYLS